MDHDATREQLELAAAEPGGLDRLMAGDTAAAQAVAAHLAGCESCSEELVRLQRSAAAIRSVVRELPPEGLRERTLATVRDQGVPRPLVVAPAVADLGAPRIDAPAEPVAPVAIAAGGVAVAHRRRSRLPAALAMATTIAAAVLLSVLTTSIVIGSRVDTQLAAQAETINALEDVTTMTLAVAGQPDTQHVALAGVNDSGANGSLIFSPSSADLAVVATGLKLPPAGYEYRCWVSVDGSRQRIGKMFFSEDLAYWVGPVPALSGVSSGATFGVSLVGASGTTLDADPVLLGKL